MKKKKPVSSIMTKDVISVSEDDSLESVASIFRTKGIRHLPVRSGKKIVGIISRNDINRLTFGALFDNQEDADAAILQMLSISQVMSDKPRTVSSDTTIKEVAEIFSKAEYHSLPVVDDEELKGIVTTTDVIKYMLEQY
ncbi:MAG: CBS domain-containing protein [Chitinophagaceae bacterium]|nr:CBS domain-containing protein [Chitinophagaceae bacterium]MCW5925282.1 CBS domain-containing protein [Chitinophagaceae bacterium]